MLVGPFSSPLEREFPVHFPDRAPSGDDDLDFLCAPRPFIEADHVGAMKFRL